MAEAAVTFAVEKLGEALIHKVDFLIGVEDQVRWVRDELKSMQCFLRDAAEKKGNKEYGKLVSQWISDVREVALDAEDAIEIFTLKLDVPRRNRGLLARCACFPVDVSHINRIGKEIESIKKKLLEIKERRETYGIGNLGEVSSSSSEMVERRRRRAALVQNDINVVGLIEDTDRLLKNVTLYQKEKLSFSLIVGMGGIGKSTLARKIYNHPTIAEQFKMRAWVVVSREFQAEDILMQIMRKLSVPLNDVESKDLESTKGKLSREEFLLEKLRERLKGKQYFIVLDDMWERKDWEVLKDAFPDGQEEAEQQPPDVIPPLQGRPHPKRVKGRGRLLFTSREKIFEEREAYIHVMKVLTPYKSWKLFRKTIGESIPQELEDTGREILKNCHGLPLTITVAGGLLKNKLNSEWDKVLKQIKNFGSQKNEIGNDVLPILELSYHYLPSNLKSCFLCLAFFKEDAIIRARNLVHIWVALGLVKVPEGGEESVEKIGRRYLDELIKRNLILVKGRLNSENQPKACIVHDHLRELSIMKAKVEIGFESIIVENDKRSSSSSSSHKPRHCFVRGIEENMFRFEKSFQNKHLRSLFLQVRNIDFGTMSYCKGFELLRILDIEGNYSFRLPSMIRSLIGIRYLKLRGGFMTLPSCLDDLKNLEVLDLEDCMDVEFPDVTWKMDSLRHLYIDGVRIFSRAMEESSWHNLESLKYIRSDQVLSRQSFGRLCTLGIRVEGGEGLAKMRRFIVECTTLQAVHLKWRGALVSKELILFLCSLRNVTKLKLCGLMRVRLTADMFPINITHLTFSKSSFVDGDLMEEVNKLPNLLFLKLDGVSGARMPVLQEGFPQLEVLHLVRTYFENTFIEADFPMPRLKLLQIHDCRELNTEYLGKRLRHAQIIITDSQLLHSRSESLGAHVSVSHFQDQQL